MTAWTHRTVTPEQARKRVNSSRRKSFMLHIEMCMPTEEGKYFPYSGALTVTEAQAKKVLADMQRFYDLRKERGGALPLVTLSECDILISIGGGMFYAEATTVER